MLITLFCSSSEFRRGSTLLLIDQALTIKYRSLLSIMPPLSHIPQIPNGQYHLSRKLKSADSIYTNVMRYIRIVTPVIMRREIHSAIAFSITRERRSCSSGVESQHRRVHEEEEERGNFGSIDADPAVAMRYTECRLTPLAMQSLLKDINENTVDFLPNFDGNEVEP